MGFFWGGEVSVNWAQFLKKFLDFNPGTFKIVFVEKEFWGEGFHRSMTLKRVKSHWPREIKQSGAEFQRCFTWKEPDCTARSIK